MDGSISLEENSRRINYEENSDDQESGWTSYFYDFPAEEKSTDEEHRRSDFSEGCSSIIIISDATSVVVKKCPEKNCSRLQSYGESKISMCGELSREKRRGKGALDDDALEDTASSPVKNITTQTQTNGIFQKLESLNSAPVSKSSFLLPNMERYVQEKKSASTCACME